MPGRYDMEILKGKTFSLGFTGKMEDGQTLTFDSYTDIVCTILQPWVQAQDVASAPLLVLKKSTGEFTVSGDGTSISLDLSAAATESITFNEGRYFLDLITADIIDPFLRGKVTVFGPEDI